MHSLAGKYAGRPDPVNAAIPPSISETDVHGWDGAGGPPMDAFPPWPLTCCYE